MSVSAEFEIEARIARTHADHGGTDKDWPKTPWGIRALLTAANVMMIQGWRPITEFVMPPMVNSYDRWRMLFQLIPHVEGAVPYVCEGYAQWAMTGKRPNQKAVPRFYDAGGRVAARIEFFMPLPEPRAHE